MMLGSAEQPDLIVLRQVISVFLFAFKIYFFYFLVLGPASSKTQQLLDFLVAKPKRYWVIFLTRPKAILVLVGPPDLRHLIYYLYFLYFFTF